MESATGLSLSFRRLLAAAWVFRELSRDAMECYQALVIAIDRARFLLL